MAEEDTNIRCLTHTCKGVPDNNEGNRNSLGRLKEMSGIQPLLMHQVAIGLDAGKK